MTIPQIVDLAEALAYLGLGSTATDQQIGMVQFLKTRAEAKVRKYLRCNVTQQTYTHYLPANVHPYDIDDQKIWSGKVLRVPERPLRSVTNLYIDHLGRAGQTPGSFPASSELLNGQDFALDLASSGWCPSGRINRLSGAQWPAEPGSIKVVYVAGWTAAELQGDVTDPALDASDLHLAVLLAVANFFSSSTRWANGGQGMPITQERIADYEVYYAAPQENSKSGGIDFSLPAECISLLAPYRRKVVA